MTRPIEPSDNERSEWPDTTRAYVEYLESMESAAILTRADQATLLDTRGQTQIPVDADD